MQYLLVSDLHYRLPQLDWIAAEAHGFDAVVLAGDHLDIAGRVDLDAQVALMSAYLGRLADTTAVIANSGNHDLSARGVHGERIASWLGDLDERVVSDGGSIRLGGDLVSVCAWWEGPHTRAAVEDQLAKDAARARSLSGRWVWVYHGPPDDSPTSWSGRRHYGDEVLNDLIATHRPDVVLTGHVHQSPFVDGGSWHDLIDTTIVLNAGRQPGPVPAHVILDTDEGWASWWAHGGEERIPLPENLRQPSG